MQWAENIIQIMERIDYNVNSRNAGHELLRCILMYLVVLHHICCHSVARLETWALLPFCLTLFAVDGFVAISGWYGLRFSVRKIGNLLGQVVFYAILTYLIAKLLCVCGVFKGAQFHIGNAWFVMCYVALVVISPYLNFVSRRELPWALMILAFVDWVGRAAGLGFSVAGFGSHTFGTFLLIYLLVRQIRNGKYLVNVSRKRIWFLLAIILASIIISCYFRNAYKGFSSVLDNISPWLLYNNPLIIIGAILLVKAFDEIHLPQGLSRVLHLISPSLFAVYLIHDVSYIGKLFLIQRPMSLICGGIGRVEGMISVLIVTTVVFVAALSLDIIIRRLPVYLLRRLFHG